MYKIVHFYITFFVHSYITINSNNEKCLIDNKEDLFNTIPERTNCIIYELDEDIKKRKLEIEKEIKEFREKIMNK